MAEQNTTITHVQEYRVNLGLELGRGNFGTIYKVHHGETNEVLAVKRVSKKSRGKASIEAVRSLCVKDKISHDNIVKIYDVKQQDEYMWIFLEFCDLGDLGDFFEGHQETIAGIEPKVKLMRQIIRGVAFLHTKDIVHRDIKPANILVTRLGNVARVKLGDFGLAKILDPDGSRSSMSSDVGTLAFKAPEFWDMKEDDKPSYRRNIDVYAAGLTFAAMIQYQPGSRLVPRAEGSIQPPERRVPIGLVAYNRSLQNHTDIRVVEINSTDDSLTKKVKGLIGDMTHVSSELRLSATAVECRLAIMNDKTDLALRHRLKADEHELVDAMCFLNHDLVLRVQDLSTETRSFKMYSGDSGNLTAEWNPECQHRINIGSMLSCGIFNGSSEEELVEGCPECEVIRVYDTITNQARTIHENLKPKTLCRGPGMSLLVWDGTTKSVKQLVYREGVVEVLHRLGSFDWHLLDMCYVEHNDTALLLTFIGNLTTLRIRGFNLATKHLTWKQSCSLDDAPLNPEDFCATSAGFVYVAHGNRLFSLDPVEGVTMETVLDDSTLGGVSEVVCSTHAHADCRIAIRHGSYNREISCYVLNLKAAELEMAEVLYSQ